MVYIAAFIYRAASRRPRPGSTPKTRRRSRPASRLIQAHDPDLWSRPLVPFCLGLLIQSPCFILEFPPHPFAYGWTVAFKDMPSSCLLLLTFSVHDKCMPPSCVRWVWYFKTTTAQNKKKHTHTHTHKHQTKMENPKTPSHTCPRDTSVSPKRCGSCMLLVVLQLLLR